MAKVSCIIPFYNERERIGRVIRQVLKSSVIDEIICVDDGSTDDTAQAVRAFSRVKLVSHEFNKGKTAAVMSGLKCAKGKFIFLLDADLLGVSAAWFDPVLVKVLARPEIDMVLFKRKEGTLSARVLSSSRIITGERILKKSELKKVIETVKPNGYELEVALNNYMIHHNKRVYWAPSFARNTLKSLKIGVLRGISEEIKMAYHIVRFIGLQNYVRQMLYFGRVKLPS